MAALCDLYFRVDLAARTYAALQLRGSDKALEGGDIERVNEVAIELAGQLPPSLAVFLLTDDVRYVARLGERLGGRLLVPDCERSEGATGVHFMEGGDPWRRGAEVMRDTYLALSAERFIGNGYSNVAGVIALLRNWPRDRCPLVAPPALL